MSTKQEIINKFHLYMDDSSELSTQEESDLFDRILEKIYTERPWEFLKKSASLTQSTTLPYVALPDDFVFFTENANYSDISEEASGPVVFIGTQYSPFKIINWSDRRQYRNHDGYAYLDITNRRLQFANQPGVANAIEFDYHFLPDALTSGQSPVFPRGISGAGERAIFHGMCIDSFVIQQVDKAKSYAAENASLYASAMLELAYFNAKLIQMN